MNRLTFAWLPVYCQDTNCYQWFTNVYRHEEAQTWIHTATYYTKKKLVLVYE